MISVLQENLVIINYVTYTQCTHERITTQRNTDPYLIFPIFSIHAENTFLFSNFVIFVRKICYQPKKDLRMKFIYFICKRMKAR